MQFFFLHFQISQDFGFHPTLQRWVIGKRLAQDQETLYSHGIRKSGDQAFLFILSANAAQLTRQQHNQDQEQQRIAGRYCIYRKWCLVFYIVNEISFFCQWCWQ